MSQSVDKFPCLSAMVKDKSKKPRKNGYYWVLLQYGLQYEIAYLFDGYWDIHSRIYKNPKIVKVGPYIEQYEPEIGVKRKR